MKNIYSAIEMAMREKGFSVEASRDIAFHMTDWLSDFAELQQFFMAPDKLTSDEILYILTNFLVHVPAHVAAAAKLVTSEPVTDVFGLGAVSEGKIGR